MAAAVAHPNVASDNNTVMLGNLLAVTGNLTIDANPATYVSGGIACSFALPLIKAQRPPIFVDITSQNGFTYAFIPGTTVTNGLLKIFTALGTELGNGAAIPAGNSGDVVNFQAFWIGQN